MSQNNPTTTTPASIATSVSTQAAPKDAAAGACNDGGNATQPPVCELPENTPPPPFSPLDASFRKITSDGVTTVSYAGQTFLELEPRVLTELATAAFHDASFFLRASQLDAWAAVLQDPQAHPNERFVVASLLKNAVISAEGVLPLCQDTGTATVVAKRGERVLTGAVDEHALQQGIARTYQEHCLRFSQIAASSMFDESNTGTNLPAQIDIGFALRSPGAVLPSGAHSMGGSGGSQVANDANASDLNNSGRSRESGVAGSTSIVSADDNANLYEFLFIAKGGGSANKTALFQETRALLRDDAFTAFLRQNIAALGVAACPPYHLAVVVGGTSPETNLKTLKLATAGALDHLPTSGNAAGDAFRDLNWERQAQQIAAELGLGAQFGGRWLTLDTRVIRLPRHAGSCPVSIGVSCSAHRNILGRITPAGAFLERLDTNPARLLPLLATLPATAPVHLDLERPMSAICADLARHPVGTLLLLSGTMIVARDMAHARLYAMLQDGQAMPDYFRRYPVYYAGPAKTPEGTPIGSFGPTTAQRMDGYLDTFMAAGASLVTLAKGNRAASVTEACRRHGGFYLGTIGGAAALLARENITAAEVLDFPEYGMEAVRKITVQDLPAFVVIDNQGHSLY